MKKLKYFILILLIANMGFFSYTIFAEDEDECPGWMTGTSNPYHADIGTMYADLHDEPLGEETGPVPLPVFSVLPPYDETETGLAPEKSAASCVGREGAAEPTHKILGNDGEYGMASIDEYPLKGWIWNDNLGFISLFCNGEVKHAPGNNLGYSCGLFDYGVKVGVPKLLDLGAEDKTKIRNLYGYGWNQAFGYIKMNGENYGVYASEPDGGELWPLHGYAWTSAGVYMNFDGLYLQLPKVDDPITIDVVPNPDELGGDALSAIDLPSGVRVADGLDYYDVYIRTYGRDSESGEWRPKHYAEDDYDVFLDFVWEDSVKANQIVEYDEEGERTLSPFSAENSGLVYKPELGSFHRKVSGVGFVRDKIFQGGDSPDCQSADYCYQLKPENTIRSYAPTDDMNFSEITSVELLLDEEPDYFNNNNFLNLDEREHGEGNYLKLKQVDYIMISEDEDLPAYMGTIFPNDREEGMELKFKPAFELKDLYQHYLGVKQDVIHAIRNVVTTITMRGQKNGEGLDDLDMEENFDLDMYIAYTPPDDDSCDDGFEGVVGDTVHRILSFSFMIFQQECDECIAANVCPIDAPACEPDCPICDLKYDEEPNPARDELHPLEEPEYAEKWNFDFDEIQGEVPVDVNIFAEFNEGLDEAVLEDNEDLEKACLAVQAPSLFSIISYSVGGKDIKYYSNKLPRLGEGCLENPSANVHGPIYSQTAFSDTYEIPIHKTTRQVASNTVKDVVKNNLERIYGDFDLDDADGGKCTITAMDVDGATVTGCTEDSNYVRFKTEDEQGIYFKNSDVYLDLETINEDPRQTWIGDQIIVVSGGNLYVESDLYNESMKSLALVVFREEGDAEGDSGNLYVDVAVKNIQAHIVADGSVFSWMKGRDNLIPKNATGVYSPVDLHDFYRSMADEANQFLLEGGVFSKNTIGGGPSRLQDDKKMLTGTNVTIEGEGLMDQYRGMFYDWNYFRLFNVCYEEIPPDRAAEGLSRSDNIPVNLYYVAPKSTVFEVGRYY
jgi:hypothetical protein